MDGIPLGIRNSTSGFALRGYGGPPLYERRQEGVFPRAIKLLRIPGKVYFRVLERRVAVSVGFLPSSGIVYQIYSFSKEIVQPIYICFVALEKALSLVGNSGLR